MTAQLARPLAILRLFPAAQRRCRPHRQTGVHAERVEQPLRRQSRHVSAVPFLRVVKDRARQQPHLRHRERFHAGHHALRCELQGFGERRHFGDERPRRRHVVGLLRICLEAPVRAGQRKRCPCRQEASEFTSADSRRLDPAAHGGPRVRGDVTLSQKATSTQAPALFREQSARQDRGAMPHRYQSEFEAFAARKTREAATARIEFLSTTFASGTARPRAIGNAWTRSHYGGDFDLVVPPEGRVALSLVFVGPGTAIPEDPTQGHLAVAQRTSTQICWGCRGSRRTRSSRVPAACRRRHLSRCGTRS